METLTTREEKLVKIHSKDTKPEILLRSALQFCLAR